MDDFAGLEEQKAQLLEAVAGWSPERLAFRPAASEWSTVNVLDHLARTERSISAMMARNFGSPHPIHLRDRLGVLLLAAAFRTPRRVKVPRTATQVLPAESTSYTTVCAEWAGTRVFLQKLLGKAPPAAQERGVFRHPVGGWMTMPQTLQFFSLHMVHHRFQLRRLEQASQGM